MSADRPTCRLAVEISWPAGQLRGGTVMPEVFPCWAV
jgi:hypothetical protein